MKFCDAVGGVRLEIIAKAASSASLASDSSGPTGTLACGAGGLFFCALSMFQMISSTASSGGATAASFADSSTGDGGSVSGCARAADSAMTGARSASTVSVPDSAASPSFAEGSATGSPEPVSVTAPGTGGGALSGDSIDAMMLSMISPSPPAASVSASVPAWSIVADCCAGAAMPGSGVVVTFAGSVLRCAELVCGACSTATPQADSNITAATNPECLCTYAITNPARIPTLLEFRPCSNSGPETLARTPVLLVALHNDLA